VIEGKHLPDPYCHAYGGSGLKQVQNEEDIKYFKSRLLNQKAILTFALTTGSTLSH